VTILDVRVGLWTVLTDCRMDHTLTVLVPYNSKTWGEQKRREVQQLMVADDLQLVQHTRM
jgi:hypothetical protein